MLVRLAERVLPRRVQQRAARGRLILRDHLLAAARVAGQRIAAEKRVLVQQSCCHKGIHQRDKPACVAAGHGDAPGLPDAGLLQCGELRKAVAPAGSRAVRRRGVEHNSVRVFHPRRRFLRRCVRQTQKRGVCLVEQLPAAAFVLSLRFRKRQKLDVAARLQTVEDAQAGRPGAAVDKHLFHRDPSTAGTTRLFDATNIHHHA